MATKANRVTKEEWEKHKATILELYCERGLPLTQGKNTQGEHECVDRIMKHQHGFVASKSQFEAQLRLWGATKNLKQSEWLSLLSDYDRLELQGKDVRIVIFGQVQAREKINKARHRYMKRPRGVPSTASLGQAVAMNRQSFIEINENGQWSRYGGENTQENSDALAAGSDDLWHDNEGREEATPSPGIGALSPQHQLTPYRAIATLVEQSVELDIPSLGNASWEIDPIYQSMLGITINHSGTSFGQGCGVLDPIQEFMQFDSPDSNARSASASTPIVRPNSWHHGGSFPVPTHDSNPGSLAITTTTTSSSLSSPSQSVTGDLGKTLAMLLQGKSGASCVGHSPGAFETRGLIDRFTSLLSVESIFWGPRHSTVLVQPSYMADPVLFNTLLYSIINGFAGLENAPRAFVLGALRENRGFFSHISKLLRTGPDSVARPIFDNLFPAAIQAGDAEAVTLLLQATRNHPGILIDLNKSVFHVSTGIYTPLGLAVMSGSAEVVRVILEGGADPNRPVRVRKESQSQSALIAAMETKFLEKDYPILELVRLLLNHGAEITARSMERAVQSSTENPLILEEFVQRLPDKQHMICFSRWSEGTPSPKDSIRISPRYFIRTLIEYIPGSIEESVATFVVKKLVQDCMSSNCKSCILDNPDVISSMLLFAAGQGNLELVAFLAQYTTSLHQALAAAVKSGNHQLVTFLLENGARADGPAVYNRASSLVDDPEPSTPLAEAIRQEDQELVETLAEYGAWRRLDDKDHAVAAIIAAAETGSIQHLGTALRHITSVAYLPNAALIKAIKGGNTECALALLRAGTPTSENSYARPHASMALSLSLQTRNKDIVDALLDCGVVSANIPVVHVGLRPERRCTMEYAGQWGDTGVIDALASMGADLDAGLHTTALAAAVTSRNRPLVDHILSLGADPGRTAESGCSPLSEAVKNKDHSMMDHLLSKGATPADDSAFLAAMECDQVALMRLCSAFKQKYPVGLKAFGGEVMARAVRANNAASVRLCLDMKFDLASTIEVELPDRKSNPNLRHEERRVNLLGLAIQLAKDDDTQVVDLMLRYGALANDFAARHVRRVKEIDSGWFETPLLLGITKRSKKMVNLLLENGADINCPARRGIFYTPLQRACKLGSYELVELLLQKGAEINSPAARRYGGTALQFAARSGSLKIVELLLLNKADPHAPGSEFGEGGTAFEFAAEYGRYHVLLLLWNKAPRDGFTATLLRSAQGRAERNGHRGCVDFITNITHDASFGRLISEGM